jgi:hypothetical protein
MNSDMFVSDYWLDFLLDTYTDHKCIPCSLLVESGRIGSGMPEYVRNLGMHPHMFDVKAWETLSKDLRLMHTLRGDHTEPGRLFMPAMFDKKVFLEMGGYPEGNVNGVPGDQILFNKYKSAGYEHLTVKSSVVYHVQEGEMRG